MEWAWPGCREQLPHEAPGSRQAVPWSCLCELVTHTGRGHVLSIRHEGQHVSVPPPSAVAPSLSRVHSLVARLWPASQQPKFHAVHTAGFCPAALGFDWQPSPGPGLWCWTQLPVVAPPGLRETEGPEVTQTGRLSDLLHVPRVAQCCCQLPSQKAARRARTSRWAGRVRARQHVHG